MRGRERNKELQTSMKKRHRPAASCTPPTEDVPATKDVPLEDVAVVFSQKEWGLLDEAQRRLYCEVVLEVFSLVSFQGHCHTMDGVEAYSEPGVPVGDSRVKASMKPPATQRTHLCRPCFSVLKATLHLTASQVAYFKKHVFFGDASCFRANPQEQRRKDASGETPWKKDSQGAPLGTCCPCFLSGVPAAGAEAGDHPRAISRLLLHQAALGETHPPGAGQKQKAAARRRRRRRRGLCSSGDGIDESDARGKARGRSTVSPPPGRAQAAEDERADGRKVSGESTEGSGAHAKKKRYQCGDCDKSFRYKSDFARHRRVHTGEKPYGCGECGRHFSQRTDLAAHRRVHTGERPYACGDCGRPFSQKTDLTKHRRVHTGEKPYRCGPCGKAFSKSYSLSRHQRRARCSRRRGEGGNSPVHKRRYRRRVHTGERPYGCSECGQTFRHRSDPCTHRKRAHPGEEP